MSGRPRWRPQACSIRSGQRRGALLVGSVDGDDGLQTQRWVLSERRGAPKGKGLSGGRLTPEVGTAGRLGLWRCDIRRSRGRGGGGGEKEGSAEDAWEAAQALSSPSCVYGHIFAHRAFTNKTGLSVPLFGNWLSRNFKSVHLPGARMFQGWTGQWARHPFLPTLRWGSPAGGVRC